MLHDPENVLYPQNVQTLNKTINKINSFFFAETFAKTGMILVGGEISSRATIDYQKVVRDTIKHIGYDDSSKGELTYFLSF